LPACLKTPSCATETDVSPGKIQSKRWFLLFYTYS